MVKGGMEEVEGRDGGSVVKGGIDWKDGMNERGKGKD